MFNLETNKSSWRDVFSESLGKIVVNQTIFIDKVMESNGGWSLDFDKGIFSLGDDEFPFQFIGSESNSSNTWLWGWENVNGFPDDLLDAANQTRKFGEECGLMPLMTAELELTSEIYGHTLSIIAASIFGGKACYYYAGSEDG
ncbi:MAG: hypothetical protein FWC69_06115, partial [Defluviitaleaceae bacterium]|nr:hypothetical protein [Defluviitaleaceae bacterium]